jgi:hypothetical protein
LFRKPSHAIERLAARQRRRHTKRASIDAHGPISARCLNPPPVEVLAPTVDEGNRPEANPSRLQSGVIMRLAWFRPSPLDRDDVADPATQLGTAIAARHSVEIFDERNAHDFVWRHARGQFDLTVYELQERGDNAFIWPYLLRYPGLLCLHSSQLVATRPTALSHSRPSADLHAQREFDEHIGWPTLAVPVLASKLVVVSHRYLADALRAHFADANIRHLPPGTRKVEVPERASAARGITVGVVPRWRHEREVLTRAAARAREAGAVFTIFADTDVRTVIERSDVVVALECPANGHVQGQVLAALSAGRPTIVYDMRETADIPSLDPQTWQPRGLFRPAPSACVAIDARDEEHSLMLALRLLSRDEGLRATLGDQAHQWWRNFGTLEAATDGFERILREACRAPTPPRPAKWPPHLDADGCDAARQTLRELGLSLDVLG